MVHNFVVHKVVYHVFLITFAFINEEKYEKSVRIWNVC